MLYERSQSIEQRITRVLELVKSGDCSTPRIAEELGVSVPTVSRCIEALRHRGHKIRSERKDGHWCYQLEKSGARRAMTSGSSAQT
jgi:biotin operon repressor